MFLALTEPRALPAGRHAEAHRVLEQPAVPVGAQDAARGPGWAGPERCRGLVGRQVSSELALPRPGLRVMEGLRPEEPPV